MTRRSKKERKQLGLELNPELNDMIESAVAELGGSRASNVIEMLTTCFPIWFKLKVQQKNEEIKRLQAALDIAMNQQMSWASDEMKAEFVEALKKQGYLPETVKFQPQEQPPRRKRK